MESESQHCVQPKLIHERSLSAQRRSLISEVHPPENGSAASPYEFRKAYGRLDNSVSSGSPVTGAMSNDPKRGKSRTSFRQAITISDCSRPTPRSTKLHSMSRARSLRTTLSVTAKFDTISGPPIFTTCSVAARIADSARVSTPPGFRSVSLLSSQPKPSSAPRRSTGLSDWRYGSIGSISSGAGRVLYRPHHYIARATRSNRFRKATFHFCF